MAVFKNFNGDELIINCKCGCDEGIHFAIKKDDDDYCFVSFTNGNFYGEQKRPFIEKVKKIWAIIRNKDFYYSDICMSKDEFGQFRDWIDRKNENNHINVSGVIAELDKFAMNDPDNEIVVETSNGTISAKLSDANIYEDAQGNIVIDCE